MLHPCNIFSSARDSNFSGQCADTLVKYNWLISQCSKLDCIQEAITVSPYFNMAASVMQPMHKLFEVEFAETSIHGSNL